MITDYLSGFILQLDRELEAVLYKMQQLSDPGVYPDEIAAYEKLRAAIDAFLGADRADAELGAAMRAISEAKAAVDGTGAALGEAYRRLGTLRRYEG